jgi:replicative DNA helicase
MAKSISRLTYAASNKTAKPKTSREIISSIKYQQYSPEEQDLIKTSIERYSEYASHIYISEGIGDIGAEQVRATLDKHILFAGNRPVIIIDYLQLMAPNGRCITDRQSMEKTVLEVKRISRDYKLPVLAISCFERQDYNSPLTMEARESWAADYICDALIGLQVKGAGDNEFNTDLAVNSDHREIELRILKNRNGTTDKKLFYEYYPMFNYFVEIDG